ncbi:meiotically up-regulated gene 154 protein [Aspergillus udagawae]|uniref:Meiotically up-regulated gene 154 protein n=1 Tax=Aspergillus udagawae TaxID=91492 RepID=A0A8H3NYI0_9EURO|nr:uncharacterized protein Aud_001093 [Aspergillus udagawae]GFF40800.1 meiotically up-regulated gene 154 protein [Aspergillus udagawae]GFF81074.1 meiotically up-regulated gene 154 protein [Aspergillus udagawae]GFG04108.1 meiotically up-regulated gene 154 protein [Aspergillus udagawae]GFG21779.1 meiotically up-regulated gene 154 protein [Aspergillus udagawae]GIC85263.1 hypothetical protein Aud_001093 [Aspergillus udagawae]
MPRLVRRQPLAERIRSYLNPLDFLLWLSEEIDANAWDQFEKDWALPLGAVLNLAFLTARANSRSSGSRAIDDVFGDDGGVPWASWFASFIVHLLACFSAFNTFYTFYRKRLYRLFEASIDQPPATPSARRVRVDSTPMTASPLRYFANVIAGSAESRAHPDAQRDVWELAVWDPLPICLRLFCLFSPGHVLVYWVFLPTQLSDPQPSVTIVTTIFITTLLSVQMLFLSSSFTQQAKDSMVVHKEVLNEYDTKFVHPRTQPVMRDVGTQFSDPNTSQPGSDAKYNKVDTFTPTRVIHRGFKTSPNPNYVSFVDPEGASTRRRTFATPNTSHNYTSLQTPSHLRDASPVVRGPVASIRQPHFRPTPSATGDGGSLGVFSHANSPLRRSTPANIDRRVQNPPDFLFKDRGTPMKRLSSPLKKSNVPGNATPLTSTPRRTQNDPRRETGWF